MSIENLAQVLNGVIVRVIKRETESEREKEREREREREKGERERADHLQ